MKLLLDTHTVLWMVSDDPRLPASARKLIVAANEVHWSIASLWEIGIKLSLNRPDFQLGPAWSRAIPDEMQRNQVSRLDLTPSHCELVSKLPWHHRDPFDRLIVAQAIGSKLTLISRDERLDDYGVKRRW